MSKLRYLLLVEIKVAVFCFNLHEVHDDAIGGEVLIPARHSVIELYAGSSGREKAADRGIGATHLGSVIEERDLDLQVDGAVGLAMVDGFHQICPSRWSMAANLVWVNRGPEAFRHIRMRHRANHSQLSVECEHRCLAALPPQALPFRWRDATEFLAQAAGYCPRRLGFRGRTRRGSRLI